VRYSASQGRGDEGPHPAWAKTQHGQGGSPPRTAFLRRAVSLPLLECIDHDYELYLAMEDVDHSRTTRRRTGSLSSTGRPSVRRSMAQSPAGRSDWIKTYNEERCTRAAGASARRQCRPSLTPCRWRGRATTATRFSAFRYSQNESRPLAEMLGRLDPSAEVVALHRPSSLCCLPPVAPALALSQVRRQHPRNRCSLGPVSSLHLTVNATHVPYFQPNMLVNRLAHERAPRATPLLSLGDLRRAGQRLGGPELVLRQGIGGRRV
jgi:hypothetical protein